MSYAVGEPVTLAVTFTDADGAPVDPSAISLSYGATSAAPVPVTWPPDGAIVSDDTGAFHAVIVPDAAGTWVARWTATGAYPGVTEQSFDVRASVAPWLTDDPAVYASIAEFRDYIRAEAPDTLNDDVLRACLVDASRTIDAETGRQFYLGDTGEARIFTAYDPAYVDIAPAQAVTEVAIDYDGEGTYETVAEPSQYYAFPAVAPFTQVRPRITWQLWPSDTWAALFPQYPLRIRVTGTYGELPDAKTRSVLRRATLILASRYLTLRDAPLGVIESGMEGAPAQVIRWTPDLKLLIDNLRAPFARDWIVT